MNKHSKGRRVELACRKVFEKAGWLTDVKNWSRWGAKDFYNMWDFIAIRGSMVRFIQVKSNRTDMYKAKKRMKAWMEDNEIYVDSELWLKENRKDWQVWTFYKYGNRIMCMLSKGDIAL